MKKENDTIRERLKNQGVELTLAAARMQRGKTLVKPVVKHKECVVHTNEQVKELEPSAGSASTFTWASAHVHKDEHGLLVKCYHQCRTAILSFGFWLGVTVSFPIEHFLWHHVPPFSWLSYWMGM